MGEFTWITLSLLFLQISAEVTEENVFVRNGSDATLPCGNVMDGQHECNGTTWNFVRKETAEELVGHGKIKPEFQSDRLAVTADCSLLIKNVTKEDANQYTCQQYRYNPIKGVHRYGGDAKVYLSVVTFSGFPDWAKFFIASGLAALLVTTVVLLIWNRKKGEKTQMGEGTVADPEDAVPYASVHFTKKARKAGAQRKNDDDDDDDDDAVTYSTVKASSSSAADSCDPSILYATVNKPK
ncbi:uncharacterized protein LOC115415497 isoform X3 [Sphaeramia orbicularis]|uniref:uncharacterized protein LOC115415497 isoform X3 n=1 Tax=Sphaeramia orbicularis TaxID=375764 RepID=UPI00117E0E7B|nr:uncharacterized protein LOC115415497 isoform X3 [Sphaeramia orbicularis]